jgi:multidrug efflux pump subunit AcrA (membrane-fusion protein)
MATDAGQRIATDHPADGQVESLAHAPVDNLYQLLDQELAEDAFYSEILSRANQSLGATNAAVWRASSSGTPSLVCQFGVEQRTLFRGETTQQQQLRLIGEVFHDGRSRSVPLIATSAESRNQDKPNYVLYLQPVVVAGSVAATIQVIRWENPRSDAGQRTSWVLATLAAIAAAFHHNQSIRQYRRATEWQTQFESFIRAIHESLDPRQIASTIANSGPQLLDCDRILVLLRRGAVQRVVAATGQSRVHRRANAVRSAERLMSSLPHIDRVIRYPEGTAMLAPRDVESFEAYLDETHSKSVAVCFFSVLTEGAFDTSATKRDVFGGFIAEKYSGMILPDSDVARAKLMALHGAQAIRSANEHHSIFLLPVWRALGRLSARFKTRLARSIISLLLLAAGLLALVYVPADFNLMARGEIQPARRQHVFARIDGTIDDLLVSEGQQVAQDEVLARLSNPELDLELEKVAGELRTTNEKLAAVKSARLTDRSSDRGGNTADRSELAAQEEELRQWIASLHRQQALLEEQRMNLLVRSPLAGEVITWNVHPTLRQRPVRRGQLLMTIADLQGPWGLELFLADRHVGHFLEAQDQLKRPLDVVFTLATNPNEQIVGQVKETAKSIQLEQQDGASLLVVVEFDRDKVKFLQPGATVSAKIRCGRRPLGYVWLHELWEFLQYRVLFRF